MEGIKSPPPSRERATRKADNAGRGRRSLHPAAKVGHFSRKDPRKQGKNVQRVKNMGSHEKSGAQRYNCAYKSLYLQRT